MRIPLFHPGRLETPKSRPRWRVRLGRDRAFKIATVGLALLALAVVVGPWISPYSEAEVDLYNSYAAPSREHWFGTDELGRDQLTRVLYGGRISLAVGLVGAAVSLIIGVLVGGIAAMAGGWIETAILRLIDFLYAVPLLLVVIVLMVVLGQESGQGLRNIYIALGLVYWLQMARMVRARAAEVRTREFVEAARALGAGFWRRFVRHVLPNTTGVIVVTATFMVPQAIFAESFLSFLGLGVTLPHASWGTLAANGLSAMQSYPHVLTFPALAICLTMFLFQALGEALRGALDPRESQGD